MLIVSPPVCPPWTNGTKLLARDLATGAQDFRYRVMGRAGQGPLGPRAEVEAVYGRTGRDSGMRAHLRLMARLAKPDSCDVHHFFFAPNPKASTASRGVLSVTGKASVHTLPSQPAPEHPIDELMFADHLVALTDATALLLRSAGFDAVDVVRPAVAVPTSAADRHACRQRLARRGGPRWGDEPVFLYAGDLEFSDGAWTFVEAAGKAAQAIPGVSFAMACRPKTEDAARAEKGIRGRVDALKLARRMRYLGVVDDMPSLLGAVDGVVLAVDTLYGKVDIPYVVLEAMALGTPAIVSALPTLAELHALGPGTSLVPPSDADATAAAMVALAEAGPRSEHAAEAARRTVTTHFRQDVMVTRYEAIYRDLLSRRGVHIGPEGTRTTGGWGA